jgi:ring-1,2-phenylacetyl-CoA epoxidase subunit PaaB
VREAALAHAEKRADKQHIPGRPPNDRQARKTTPLWEVFIRPRNGLHHRHVGSLHAADAKLALQAARDVYTRRGEGNSIWVVPLVGYRASDPSFAEPNFEPADDKIYRHPTFYDIPDEVGHM